MVNEPNARSNFCSLNSQQPNFPFFLLPSSPFRLLRGISSLTIMLEKDEKLLLRALDRRVMLPVSLHGKAETELDEARRLIAENFFVFLGFRIDHPRLHHQ